MKDKLTPKEAKFLKAYLQGKKLNQCAKDAGCKSKNEQSLSVMGHQIFKRLNISMSEVMDLKGLTDAYVEEKILEGIETDKLHIRDRYINLYGRFKGKFIDKTELTGSGGAPLVIQLVEPQTKGSKESLNIDIDK